MKHVVQKTQRRSRRKLRIRGRLHGSAKRPRMTVFRSNRHLYVQVIDDQAGHTLASASTLQADGKGLGNTTDDAAKLGTAIGKQLDAINVTEIVFDRNGYRYHGVIKALADSVRKSGVKF